MNLGRRIGAATLVTKKEKTNVPVTEIYKP